MDIIEFKIYSAAETELMGHKIRRERKNATRQIEEAMLDLDSGESIVIPHTKFKPDTVRAKVSKVNAELRAAFIDEGDAIVFKAFKTVSQRDSTVIVRTM